MSTRAIAASLQAMEMGGERALLLYPSGLDFVAAFFGCLYAGVTAVPAYPPRRNRNMARIDAIANDAEAKIALTTFEVLERVQTMIADTPALQRIRWRATDQWDDDQAGQWQRPDVHGDTLAFGPSLPSALSRLCFGLLYRDRRLRVEITSEEARYELVAGEPIEILHHGEAVALAPDAPIAVPWPSPTPPEGDVGPPPGRAPAHGS